MDNERIIKERGIWEKVAGNYDNNVRVYDKAYSMSIEKASNVLEKNHKVLEIACGTGIISLGIAHKVSRVTAVDISPNMISVAKAKAEKMSVNNVEFNIADGYSLGYEDGTFDVVLLFNALHIVKEPKTLLYEINRLLKPGGYLVTATDCYEEPVPFMVRIKLFLQGIARKLGIISYIWDYKKVDVAGLLKEKGFKIVENDVLHPAPVNYYVLGQKMI